MALCLRPASGVDFSSVARRFCINLVTNRMIKLFPAHYSKYPALVSRVGRLHTELLQLAGLGTGELKGLQVALEAEKLAESHQANLGKPPISAPQTGGPFKGDSKGSPEPLLMRLVVLLNHSIRLKVLPDPTEAKRLGLTHRSAATLVEGSLHKLYLGMDVDTEGNFSMLASLDDLTLSGAGLRLKRKYVASSKVAGPRDEATGKQSAPHSHPSGRYSKALGGRVRQSWSTAGHGAVRNDGGHRRASCDHMSHDRGAEVRSRATSLLADAQHDAKAPGVHDAQDGHTTDPPHFGRTRVQPDELTRSLLSGVTHMANVAALLDGAEHQDHQLAGVFSREVFRARGQTNASTAKHVQMRQEHSRASGSAAVQDALLKQHAQRRRRVIENTVRRRIPNLSSLIEALRAVHLLFVHQEPVRPNETRAPFRGYSHLFAPETSEWKSGACAAA